VPNKINGMLWRFVSYWGSTTTQQTQK
jgi:hypothetical protein